MEVDNNPSPLHAAARDGDVAAVQQLLAAGTNIESPADGMTALHAAAAAGKDEMVQVLLAAGANREAKDSSDRTALIVAATHGHHEVVDVLLKAGASIEAATAEGVTPLCAAASAGHVGTARVLLAANANISAASNAMTPLHMAVFEGHPKMVQLLLSEGADPKRQVGGGDTALAVSADRGDAGIVQLLLDAWGQPPITAVTLVEMAKIAARREKFAELATLITELQRLYPAELQKLFEGQDPVPASLAMAEVLDAWVADVSDIEAQQAAVRQAEEDVSLRKKAVQQLLIQMACEAKVADKGPAKAHT
jgi:ankyrin repeat protein